MHSDRRRALDQMADAERRLQRSPWADQPFADLQRAAARLTHIDVIAPARQAEARKAHMAGRHLDAPTIGTCVVCLDAYVTGR